MLPIDLSGKRALVAGVADDGGFGFAVAKAFAEAGASVCVATWPPALTIFLNLLERGKMDESRRLSDGSLLTFEKIYPLDAAFDSMSDVPADIRENKRYKDHNDFSVDGVVSAMTADFGAQPIDIVFHSLANGPEVKKPLLETSRGGYLSAIGTSAYSLVSTVQRFGPIMRPGGSFCSLTYMASERMIPGYGGGMSSAKAALESDTRVLSFEAGRKYGARVNTISAGPYASRAASAIGIIDKMVQYCTANSPLAEALTTAEVGNTAAFLASGLASGVTGATIYVDKGYHSMGMAVTRLLAWIYSARNDMSGAKEPVTKPVFRTPAAPAAFVRRVQLTYGVRAQLIVLALFIALPLLVGSAYRIYKRLGESKARVVSDVERTAETIAERIEERAHSSESLIIGLSAAVRFDTLQQRYNDSVFAATMAKVPLRYGNMFAWDKSGVRLGSAVHSPALDTIHGQRRPYFSRS